VVEGSRCVFTIQEVFIPLGTDLAFDAHLILIALSRGGVGEENLTSWGDVRGACCRVIARSIFFNYREAMV